MFSFLRVTLGTISQGTKGWHKLLNWQGEKQSAGTAWVGQQQLCLLPCTVSASSPRDPEQRAMAQVSQHNHRSQATTNRPHLLAELHWLKFKMRVNWAYSQRLVSRSRQTQHTLHSRLWQQLRPPTILFLRAAVVFPIFFHLSLQALHLCSPIWPASPSLSSSPCNPLRALVSYKTAHSDMAAYSNRRQKPFHRHFPQSNFFSEITEVSFFLHATW